MTEHDCQRIPCPDSCNETLDHSHWRCDDCRGWMTYSEFGSFPFFDLYQPAPIIYPRQRKEET